MAPRENAIYFNLRGGQDKLVRFMGAGMKLGDLKAAIMKREAISPKSFDLNVVHKYAGIRLLDDETMVPGGIHVKVNRIPRKALVKSKEESELEQLKKEAEELEQRSAEAKLIFDKALKMHQERLAKEQAEKPKYWRVVVVTAAEMGICKLLVDLEKLIGHSFKPSSVQVINRNIILHVENKEIADELRVFTRRLLHPISRVNMPINIERGPPMSPTK